MIKHIVFWKLKEFAEGADRASNMHKVKDKLMAISNVVPGIVDFEVGLAESGLEASHDVALYSSFESEAALQAYAVHPDHEAVKAFIKSVVENRVVMDYKA